MARLIGAQSQDLGALSPLIDDGQPQRWRAVGPSGHSADTLFLRSEAKFLKQLKKARIVRFEADFFHEGRRIFEFPVARFDAGQFM